MSFRKALNRTTLAYRLASVCTDGQASAEFAQGRSVQRLFLNMNGGMADLVTQSILAGSATGSAMVKTRVHDLSETEWAEATTRVNPAGY